MSDLPKQTIYFINASTGCTCCSNENFTRGPYLTKGEPEEIIVQWRLGNGNPLASQYAKYGRYSLSERVAEVLPDGRFIVEDEVWRPGIEDRRE